ncbi:ATP-dependent Zn protease [Pseudanabaena sp. FACHB-1998]|uniref:ATP-dependent Zn protease n=1 Tax=Pseudanabaena sp. FACHB-1998 TaxID=2692858 RepID=UPI00168084CA|nr:ATP-dependent Zn protease [Pseudanabaena sp. FACHB-1998]MBD2177807.1 ATP-dependent Zn protease [Pseudanabaena sp. FACHB-1998]
MNVTSTDVLAIAIFTITMMSLVGTMVGLSPVVPAAIAITLLSLWGIDVGFWQGKFGAYFQVWLRARDPKYRQRVCYHEAGHFLAAHVLGFKVVNYAIAGVVGQSLGEFLASENFSGLEGGVEIEIGSDFNSANLLDRYCTVYMAGIAAEQLMCEGETEGGLDDIQRLRQAISNLPNPMTQERWALLNAKNLLGDRRDILISLAAQMQSGASIEACYQTIKIKVPTI